MGASVSERLRLASPMALARLPSTIKCVKRCGTLRKCWSHAGGAMRLAPYARSVRVVPWGIDSAAFTESEPRPSASANKAWRRLTRNATDTRGVESLLRRLSKFSEPNSITFVATVISPSTLSVTEQSQQPRSCDPRTSFYFRRKVHRRSPQRLSSRRWPVAGPSSCHEMPRRVISSPMELKERCSNRLFQWNCAESSINSHLTARCAMDRAMQAAAQRRRFDWQVIIERGYRPILQRR